MIIRDERFKNSAIKCRANCEIVDSLITFRIKKFFIACDALRCRKSMSNDLEREETDTMRAVAQVVEVEFIVCQGTRKTSVGQTFFGRETIV